MESQVLLHPAYRQQTLASQLVCLLRTVLERRAESRHLLSVLVLVSVLVLAICRTGSSQQDQHH
jgi:hypothetical protein